MATHYDDAPFRHVLDTYMESLPVCSVGKQFHFLSRAYLWSKQPQYLVQLEKLREKWWKDFDVLVTRIQRIPHAHEGGVYTRGKTYRRAVHTRYPSIRLYNRFFFKLLFDQTIFHGTAHETYASCVDETHLRTLRARLVADPESVCILSTPAVNFLTLSHYFFPQSGDWMPPAFYEKVGESVALEESMHDLDAHFYLYTHALIGFTHFYAHGIPPEIYPQCVSLIERLEHFLATQYDRLSLDHKCEFLVCAQLLNYDTVWKLRVYDELLASYAPQGTHFMNTLNTYAERGEHAQSQSRMEHTNILALMAFLDRRHW